jgi:hypothetical protein
MLPEILFKSLLLSFCLPVGLRVERCAKLTFDLQDPTQGGPESGRKDGAAVRYYPIG